MSTNKRIMSCWEKGDYGTFFQEIQPKLVDNQSVMYYQLRNEFVSGVHKTDASYPQRLYTFAQTVLGEEQEEPNKQGMRTKVKLTSNQKVKVEHEGSGNLNVVLNNPWAFVVIFALLIGLLGFGLYLYYLHNLNLENKNNKPPTPLVDTTSKKEEKPPKEKEKEKQEDNREKPRPNPPIKTNKDTISILDNKYIGRVASTILVKIKLDSCKVTALFFDGSRQITYTNKDGEFQVSNKDTIKCITITQDNDKYIQTKCYEDIYSNNKIFNLNLNSK